MIFDSSSRHTFPDRQQQLWATCLFKNAYNITQKTSYVCLDYELTHLRYWIASAIETSEEKVTMEKILKSLYLKKLTCPKIENLKFIEMFLVMMARKDLNPFLIKLIILKKPLTSHLYLLKVSQVMEKIEFLTELEMKYSYRF